MKRTIRHILVILGSLAALAVNWQLMQPQERDLLKQQPDRMWRQLQQQLADSGLQPPAPFQHTPHETHALATDTFEEIPD